MRQNTLVTVSGETVTISHWVATEEALDALLRMMLDEWSSSPDAPISVLCETCYMAHCLRRVTAGFVARDSNGRIVGACLVGRITNGRPHDDASWAERERHLSETLRTMPWWHNLATHLLAEMREEDELTNRVLDTGLRPDAQILLLIVDREMRGQGIGRMLIEETGEMAERLRWGSMFLVTDTNCDWEVYERWGFARIASMPSRNDMSCLRMAYAFTPSRMLEHLSEAGEKGNPPTHVPR